MRYKYPRTYHLPFSPGFTSDDKVLKDDSQFYGKRVVVTEKMDGENTSIYNDGCHARSIDSQHKPYHSWLLNNMYNFIYDIPDNFRICGEYLYAKHSIGYDNLPSYFLAFSVWENDRCLNWEDTKEFCEALNIAMVPILYEGVYDSDLINKIASEAVLRGSEGIVVRVWDEFKYDDFSKSIAKYVRPNHVQTDKHWSQGIIEKNGLITND